jgi:hypothetical protein|nr:MAG TPA: hypothetical protein [Myoviridae sp. ctfuG5]
MMQQMSPFEDPNVVERLFKNVFDSLWLVRTKQQWIYTKADFEVFGIPTSGNLQYDQADMDQWITVGKTLAQLVEMYDKGHEFYFTKDTDIEAAFNTIVDYTNYVAYTVNNSYHLSYNNPEENEQLQEVLNDVVKMQNLGNRIFPVMAARPNFTQETSGLLGFLAGRRRNARVKLNFDPILRYGLKPEDYRNPDMYREGTGEMRVLDIRQQFNPHTASFMNEV